MRSLFIVITCVEEEEDDEHEEGGEHQAKERGAFLPLGDASVLS